MFPFLAEPHDIPDDQEVSGKAKSCDQVEFVFDLLPGPIERRRITLRAVTANYAFLYTFPKELVHAFAIPTG
jgi:hypothetical protein